MNKKEIEKLDLCDGKYTFILEDNCKLTCKRYGEDWRNDFNGDLFTIGDNAIHFLFNKAFENEQKLKKIKELLTKKDVHSQNILIKIENVIKTMI
jgi:hypothetical protein